MTTQCVGVTPQDKGGTDTLVAGTGTLDRTGRSRRDSGNRVVRCRTTGDRRTVLGSVNKSLQVMKVISLVGV